MPTENPFMLGFRAFRGSEPLDANPYDYARAKQARDTASMRAWIQWRRGWQTARKRGVEPSTETALERITERLLGALD